MSGEGFAEGRDVGLVDYCGAGVDEGGHGRYGGGAPVLEFVDGVVVQIVEEFQAAAITPFSTKSRVSGSLSKATMGIFPP